MKGAKILERYGQRVYKEVKLHGQLCETVSCITISKGASNEIVKALNSWIKNKNLKVRTGGTL
jgi:hypothetical protein